MRAFAILALAVMAATGISVGVRLLALGRRTGQQPERLIGAALLLVAAIGGPIAGLGRAPALVATPAGDAIFGIGLAATQLGIALFAAFTAHVFRRDSLAATLALLLLSGILGAEWLGLVLASGKGSTMQEIFPHTRPWGIAIVTTLALVFAWTAFESIAYAAKLRKRIALGLGDPDVARRMGLWAAAGLATVAVCAVIAACMLAGLPPLEHRLPLAALGVAPLVASVCWTLAFLPRRGSRQPAPDAALDR
jgi:hypothetical protein